MATAPSSATLVPGDTAAIDQKVEAEMTRLLYRSAGFGLFSNFVLGVLLVGGTLGAHPTALHAWWLGTLLVVSGARWALNIAFARARPEAGELHHWRRAFVVGLVI